MPRIYHPFPLTLGQNCDLTPEGARHVQVLRLQPGMALTLFGDPVQGGEHTAEVVQMGRSSVTVRVLSHQPLNREPARTVHLVVGMPANERMDWLVEKATELGVASVQPLMTERTVVRLKGERADKRQQHWQAVAVAACEQCGGNRVPTIHPILAWTDWVSQARAAKQTGVVLSLRSQTQAWADWLQTQDPVLAVSVLHGPEGGLSVAEEDAVLALGWAPVTLGARVLRAETAAVAALALAGLS